MRHCPGQRRWSGCRSMLRRSLLGQVSGRGMGESLTSKRPLPDEGEVRALRENHRLHGPPTADGQADPTARIAMVAATPPDTGRALNPGCRNPPRSSLEPAATSENPTNNMGKSNALRESTCAGAVGN